MEKSEISQRGSLKSLFNLTMLSFLASEKLSVTIWGKIHVRKLCIWYVKTCFSQKASALHVLNNVLLWAAGGAVEFHWVQLGRFYASKIPNLLSLVNPLNSSFFIFFFQNRPQQAIYPSLSHALVTTNMQQLLWELPDTVGFTSFVFKLRRLNSGKMLFAFHDAILS